jgi:hypothetical protein
MKTIEELKQEQFDAKAKLHELVEFVNSEEYYSLSQSEKNIIGQRRIALEMYLNSLTKNLYDKEGSTFDISSAMWPLLMSSMFTGSSFGSSSGVDYLKNHLEEDESKAVEGNNEKEMVYAIPE